MSRISISSLLDSKPSSLLITHSDDLSTALTILSSKPQNERTHLWSLNIRTTTLSKTSVLNLCEYLRTDNNHFTRLDLSTVQIGDEGVFDLLRSIHQARNSPIRSVFLRSVGLTRRGAIALSTVFTCSLGELQYINLSNNQANSNGVKALQAGMMLRKQAGLTPLELDLSGNLVTVELLNAVTHIIGAAGALFGGLLLTRAALNTEISALQIFSLIVYACSLLFLMSASATYHACFRYPALSKFLRKADHCGIFVLIAGTYTPFYVLYLINGKGSGNERAVLAAVWICGVVGIFRSLLGVDSNRSRAFFALATGWIGLLSYRRLFESIPADVFNLVVMGGLAYSIGIIFYLVGKRVPIMHVVWHLAVMIGGGCHYYALWKGVVE